MSSQSLSITLTGISFTLKATPAVPMPSLVSWPMVPLTCVPWPSKSSGVVVSQMKSCGDTSAWRVTSCDAAAYGIVTSPSAGYLVPFSSLNRSMFTLRVASV